MITIPDAMRRPAEVERDELRKQLAEARAEIERWKSAFLNQNAAFIALGSEAESNRLLIEQMREAIMTECEHVCEGRLRTAECDDDCKTGCHLYAVITAAERGGE